MTLPPRAGERSPRIRASSVTAISAPFAVHRCSRKTGSSEPYLSFGIFSSTLSPITVVIERGAPFPVHRRSSF